MYHICLYIYRRAWEEIGREGERDEDLDEETGREKEKETGRSRGKQSPKARSRDNLAQSRNRDNLAQSGSREDLDKKNKQSFAGEFVDFYLGKKKT